MFYILYGENDFSIKESVSRIKDDCGLVNDQADVTSFDGKRVNPDELVMACNTISLLSPKRLVIVEGLLSRFEPKDRSRRSQGQPPELKEWATFASQASTMPQSTVLVLIDGKLSRDNPLLKKLTPVAEVKEFQPPKGAELQNWVRSRVASRGANISFPALCLLIDFTGNNLWVLSNEIEKLYLYAGDRHIEEADVKSLASYAKESDVFGMVDAIIHQRLGLASQLMRQLLDEGAASPYLLYMVTNEFRLLIQAKRLSSQHLSKSAIMDKTGESKEWKVEKVLRNIRGYSLERLEKIYQRLLDTDLHIKTGAMDGEIALHLLIADLCKE